eukprot:CAMPEP_0115012224 /NCGR_PEP_ID=MMETSP0216-20121206/24585_1 /TAXON_ID=223996 /ORGANISM="Protocruzia adherens, Strain Boccale" /LENGTH=563 /DNA_ID=CAMNT_0002381191 /DNA_START=86 /DNA_END=1777 /DNA_ORIENTATION=-
MHYEPPSDHVLRTTRKGADLMRDPKFVKGLAFTQQERDAFHLRGFYPDKILTQEIQVRRVLNNLAKITDNLQKYSFLQELHERNNHLFFRVVMDNVEEMMPLIYTPTVGLACQKFGHIWRKPKGLFISLNDLGHVAEIFDNWPEPKVKVICMTDGERILGLGDLGAYGMGIPIGKLALYSACGGIHPWTTLPIQIDAGTNNQGLLEDEMYIGTCQKRISDERYDQLIEEIFTAAKAKWGDTTLIQFEDFGNKNAFRLLEKYIDQACTFNDDIQGTASVALAGLYGALKMKETDLKDEKVLIVGAGEAGIGIGDLIALAISRENGITLEEGRQRVWFVDSRGLIYANRAGLNHEKLKFAHSFEGTIEKDLLSIVKTMKPSTLIGCSAQGSIFTTEILKEMSEINERPIIFALSNPTSKSECTAEAAYTHSKGKAIFASGSPFAPVEYEGRTFKPGQANNVYIFPGVGKGIVRARATRVPAEVFYIAAKTLAAELREEEIAKGSVFPSLKRIQLVSVKIAAASAAYTYDQGLATNLPRPENLEEYIMSKFFDPRYPRIEPEKPSL